MKHYMALFFSLASLTALGSDYSDEEPELYHAGRDSGLSAQSQQALAAFEDGQDVRAQWSERQVKNAARHKRNDLERTRSAAALEEKSDQTRTSSRSISPKKGHNRVRTTSETALPLAIVGKKNSRRMAIAAQKASDAKSDIK